MQAKRRLKVKRFYKLNHQITASEVRVIGDDGKQLGVLPLSDALAKAQELEQDLVEIAPDAKPPVVKIIEFKKFKYLEDRKEKEARRHAKQTELKEVRFSPFIGEHDLQTALEKARKFISDGDLVKISIRFKGRQMAHTEFGPKLLERILSDLSDIADRDRPEKFEGRQFVTILKPLKNIPKNKNSQDENKNKESSS